MFVNNVHPSAVAICTDQISRELKGRMPLFVRPTLCSDALVTSDHIVRRGHGVAQNLATRIPLQLIDDPGRDDVLVAVSGITAVNTHAIKLVSHDLPSEGDARNDGRAHVRHPTSTTTRSGYRAQMDTPLHL